MLHEISGFGQKKKGSENASGRLSALPWTGISKRSAASAMLPREGRRDSYTLPRQQGPTPTVLG